MTTLTVIAPAGPATAARVQAGIDRLARRGFGLAMRYEPSSGRRGEQPYLAAPDAERAELLASVLADDGVEAILCVRGGYGCTRLLELLDPAACDALAARKPLIVGFSDVTALHALAAQLGAPSIHGPVLTQIGELPEVDIDALAAALAGDPQGLEGLTCERAGVASGPLVGGNLTVLASLLGTPCAPPFDDAILLLEDVGEAPYRIDRALTQLSLAGVLDSVAGVVLGDFVDCDAPQGTPPRDVRALDVVRERLARIEVPMVSGAPVGHGPRNHALLMGVPVTLDADAGTLAY